MTTALAGALLDIPAVWLRDNCRCPECVDPVSGQKLFGITDLPAAPEVTRVEESADGVTLIFAPDGHLATFTREWLAANHPAAPTTANPRTEDAKTLWHGTSHEIPHFDWDEVRTDDSRRVSCLEAVLRQGYAVLHGVPARDRAAGTDLAATQPMIGLDAKRRIREIRFNNRSMQPVSLAPENIEGFYAAYRAFAELLYEPQAAVRFRLGPGDCMVFDNTRVLHARTGFTADGERHLQGCYIDLDGVASNNSILAGKESAAWSPSTG